MFAVPLKILTLSTKQCAEDDELLSQLVVHDNGIEVAEDGGPQWGPPDTGTQLNEELSTLRRLRRFFEVSRLDWDGDGDGGVDLLGGNWRHIMLLSGGGLRNDPEYAGFSGERNSLWGYTMMQRYHASLVEAESRGFPATDDYPDGPENTVAWTSAFGTAKTVHCAGLRTERACVLFSVAALESFMGAYLTTKVGNYAAIWRYQNAAGMFRHIREMEVDSTASIPAPDRGNDGGPCSDMSFGCLSALEFLMLAQAQTCIYKIGDRWTGNWPTDAAPNMVECEYLAKLASGIAWLYGKAVASAEDGAPHMYSRWGHAMKANLALYRALAQYWQSWLDEEKANVTDGAGLGLAEGRLRLSLAFMTNDVIVHAAKGRMEMSTFKEDIMKVTARLYKVEKENLLKLRENHGMSTLVPIIRIIPHITLVQSRPLAPEFFPQKLETFPARNGTKDNKYETCLDSQHNNYFIENDKSGTMGVLNMEDESTSSRISELIESVSKDDNKSVSKIVDFLNMEDVDVTYRNFDRSAFGIKNGRHSISLEPGLKPTGVSLEPITEQRDKLLSEKMFERNMNKEEESKKMRFLAMKDENAPYKNSNLPKSVVGPSPKINEEGGNNTMRVLETKDTSKDNEKSVSTTVDFLNMEDGNDSFRNLDPSDVSFRRHSSSSEPGLKPTSVSLEPITEQIHMSWSGHMSQRNMNKEEESEKMRLSAMKDENSLYRNINLPKSVLGPSPKINEEGENNNMRFLDMTDTSEDNDKSVSTAVNFLNMEDGNVTYRNLDPADVSFRNLDRSASGMETNRNLDSSEYGLKPSSVSIELITDQRHISLSEGMSQCSMNKEEESKKMRLLAMKDENALYRNSNLPESVVGSSPSKDNDKSVSTTVDFLNMEDVTESYKNLDCSDVSFSPV
eukprot:CAMPEP_0194272624 /NCGR_PEP_ID=MMETSP0169-20130528/6138_1 /TAXON_ID=218684 /ORGANISM="Corethron pennatum, Strain L29A3" /LENGTH=903 /DNA_ID=CAMNT_0039015331 /DNA_START=73 /DNA_END=2784 /DNA_ORIENTATION=-